MNVRWLAIIVALGCGNKDAPAPAPAPPPPAQKPAAPSPPPPPPPAPPAPPATAKLDSQPFELPCGDEPLEMAAPKPAAKAAPERTLKPAAGIAECHDQASVDAVCACLAKAKKASCHAVPQGKANAVVVDLASEPASESVSPGNTLVLLTQRGAKWSPVAAVESADEVDLTETPHASARARLARLDVRATGAGTQIWIESSNAREEKSVGDLDRDGEEHGTLCIAPADAPASCYEPLTLGKWLYSFDQQKGTCEIHEVTMFAATIDPPGATLRVVHGADKDGIAGSYKFAVR